MKTTLNALLYVYALAYIFDSMIMKNVRLHSSVSQFLGDSIRCDL